MQKGKLKAVKRSMRIIRRNREIKEKFDIKLRIGYKPSAAKKQLAVEFHVSYDTIESALYREE